MSRQITRNPELIADYRFERRRLLLALAQYRTWRQWWNIHAVRKQLAALRDSYGSWGWKYV